jgi:hypothetical protein
MSTEEERREECEASADRCLREAKDRDRKLAIHDGDYLDAIPFHVPRCPWCGNPDNDWWDSKGLDGDESEVGMVCGSCERPYECTMRVRPYFSSARKK